MDKLLIRKDVYEELLEKGFGKKDYSKLTKKKITDKNGHTRTVFVRNGEQPAAQKQPKAQEGLSDEKRAKYEEMLEKVKAGSDENALFVQGKMLNKKEAIAHLEGKLGKKTVNRASQEPGIPIQGTNWLSLPSGTRVTNEGAKEKMAKNNERIETLKKLMEGNTKADNIRLNSELRSLQNENEYIASMLPPDREEKKPVNSAYQGHLESDNPPNTDITKEDEERFGKQALSGLSGKRESAKEKKSSKELNKEMEDLRSEYREKYDSLSEEEIDNYVNKLTELEEAVEEAETEETGMTKYVRQGYEGIQNVKEELLPKLKKDAEERIKFEQEALKRYKKMKPKDKIQKDSREVNIWAAQRNLDENIGRLKAINERLGSKDSDVSNTSKLSFEDSVKEYNFTDTKNEQFAMDEVAKFYPELKDVVENRDKAFDEVIAAERKLKSNPNNEEYKENFTTAYNKLKQFNEEYDKKSKKALEKAPNIEKPDFSKYMDAKRSVQKFLDTYKKQSEEYEVGKRLRDNGGAAILNPMYGLKPNDYTKDPNYIKAQMTIRAYEGK